MQYRVPSFLARPFLLALAAAALFGGTRLQAQQILWQAVYGGKMADNARAFVVNNDGSYTVVGQTRSNNLANIDKEGLDADLWVAKINAKGRIIWQKVFGGGYNEEAHCLTPMPDGGYLVAGYTDSKNFTNGRKDMFVVRLDALGAERWSRSIGGPGNDEAMAIATKKDGSFLLAGVTGSSGLSQPNKGGLDAWAVYCDPSGQVVWERNIGGGNNEQFVGVVSSGNGWLLAGQTDSPGGDIKEHRGKTDIFLTKLDREGNVNWTKTLGGSDFDIPHYLTHTLDNNLILVGTTFSTDGDVSQNKGQGDVWVVKFNHSGTVLWEHTYGGTSDEGANGVSTSYEGHYLVAATTRSNDGDVTTRRGLYDAWVLKLDPDGELMWQKTLGGGEKDDFVMVREAPSGDYLAVGNTASEDGDLELIDMHGGDDAWLVSLRDPINPPKATSLTPTTLMGYVRDAETNKFVKAEVSLVMNEENIQLSSVSSDTTYGIYQLILPDTNKMSIGVQAKGYMFKSKVVDVLPHERYSEIRFDLKLEPLKEGASVNLYDIYFGRGSADLEKASLPELDRVVEFMKKNPSTKIEISGHTDNTGTGEQLKTKKRLSLMRANAVRRHLISNGIEAWRIETKGYGMEQPVAPNDTPEGRALNRRVEFKILSVD